MYRPGTTAVLEGHAGFEAQSEQVTVITESLPVHMAGAVSAHTPAAACLSGEGGTPVPVTMAGVPSGRTLPCTDDPDLFFAESPEDVESAKDLCRGCPARVACLAGALERHEPWGVWGGELFLRGEIVPRKRPRGRPRKDEVAA